ncbi:hypothetical protein D9M72_395270 [compost metagenome]
MHRLVVAQAVHPVEQFDLRGAQPRYLGKALRRFDVGPVVAAEQLRAEAGEQRTRVVRRLALGRFAAAVEEEVCVGQAQQVRALAEQFVVDRRRADDARHATRAGRMNAHQADDVHGVVVVRQALARLVAACTRIGAVVHAQVRDMAQHIALCILRRALPQVRADAPIGERRVFQRIAIDVEAAQQDEATPLQDLFSHGLQRGGEWAQVDVRAAQPRDAEPGSARMAHRAMQHLVVLRAQAHDPFAGPAHRMASPGAGVFIGLIAEAHRCRSFLLACEWVQA